MDSYRVVFKPSVEKDLKGLTKALVARIMKRIEGLADDAFPRLGAKLSTADRLYRIRVGDYRIVYEVDSKARQITVHYVRHRREAYRDL